MTIREKAIKIKNQIREYKKTERYKRMHLRIGSRVRVSSGYKGELEALELIKLIEKREFELLQKKKPLNL